MRTGRFRSNDNPPPVQQPVVEVDTQMDAGEIEGTQVPTEPLDSASALFLSKAGALVQEHMAKSDFDVAALADALHMSRSTLRRRLEKAAGVTPAEFIRQRRLRQAHQYLESGHFRTLAETAYAVGFCQAGYFARLYRKHTAELRNSAE